MQCTKAEKLKVLDELRELRKLLEDPRRWTKGTFARNIEGFEVSASNPDAVCWCLEGAIAKIVGDEIAASDEGSIFYTPLFNVIAACLSTAEIEGSGIAGFNDAEDTTHQDVLNLLDGALEYVESADIVVDFTAEA